MKIDGLVVTYPVCVRENFYRKIEKTIQMGFRYGTTSPPESKYFIKQISCKTRILPG